MSLLLIILPLASALLAYLLKPFSKTITLLGAIANLGITLYLAAMFELGFDGMQYNTTVFSLQQLKASFALGIDGTALLFILLTNISLPLIIAMSDEQKTKNNLFYALISLFSFAMHGVYLSLDGLFYYIFWELALLPIFILLLVFGGQKSLQTYFKFFVYTLTGSLLMLVSIILLYNNTTSFALADWATNTLTPTLQTLAFIGFAAAYFIKIPIFPFHTWQPDTYTKAPTTVTMLLSAVMLKMAVFSLIRWVAPTLPLAFDIYRTLGLGLSVIGVIYASIIAIQQTDLKRMFAYSSMAHVGMIAAGVFSGANVGTMGAVVQCVNHAIISIGMFYIAELLQQRFSTYQINKMGGCRHNQPILATLFMIITLASVAMPLTNGFVGELMILKGIYEHHAWMCAFAGLSVILGAVYMLRAYMITMLGDPAPALLQADLTTKQIMLLIPIVLLIFIIGLFPTLLTQFL